MALLSEPVVLGALALLLASLPRLAWKAWSPLHVLAGAAILYPALDSLISFVDIAPLIGEYTVLQPYTAEQLDRLPVRIARRNLLVPLAGLAVVAVVGGLALSRGFLAKADKGPASWRRDLWLGLALAPLFMGAQAIGLLLLQGPAQFLQTGDESALFANATLWHVLALCIVPAVAEELYYRGLLQGLFERVLPAPGRAWAAIGLQGLIFGLAHAGFTTVSHLLGPLLFGLAMGYLASVVGLGSCMVLHAGINLAYFSVDPGAGSLGLQVAAGLIALAGLVVLWRERHHLWALARSGPAAQAAPASPMDGS